MEPFRYRRRVGFGDCDPARIFYAPRAIEYSVEAAEAWSALALGAGWDARGAPRVLSFDCTYERSIAASQEVELSVEAAAPGPDVQDLRVVAELAPGEVSFRTALRLAISEPRSADPEPVERRAPVAGAFTRAHRVRWGDCTPSGDVYAPRVAEWAVEAAGEWYERTTGVSWIEQCRRGRGTPFLRIACPVLTRMAAGTAVTMEVTIPRLGNASIGYVVVGRGEDGATRFLAEMAACYISEEAGPPRSMPFPDGHRERIRRYMAATS